MNFFKRQIKKVRNFFFDHPGVRTVGEYLYTALGAALSALIFAYGYKTFVAPIHTDVQNIVTGGASGVSQIIVKILDLFGVPTDNLIGENTSVGYVIQSISYVVINIPLAFLAFRKIGKRFAIFSVVNVSLYFVFVNLLPYSLSSFFYDPSLKNSLANDTFVRALLAGAFTGLSTGIAVQTGHSAGGIDIVSIYVTEKRPNYTMGRISMLINACIITIYTILSCIDDGNLSFINISIYSIFYFFVSSFVVDIMVTRNRKMQMQIITENDGMAEILISNFPHSATILHGKGAFAKKDKNVIYIVLSYDEIKKATKIAKEIDPKAFITVSKVEQLIGRFYVEPHK